MMGMNSMMFTTFRSYQPLDFSPAKNRAVPPTLLARAACSTRYTKTVTLSSTNGLTMLSWGKAAP